MRRIPLLTVLSLQTTISPLGIASFVAAVPLTAVIAAWILRLAPGEAALAGLLSAPVMFLSEWVHQWGHARAARRVGYPMTGMHFHSLFSSSLYPPDEPELPARTHIRRALGGFWVNLLLGLLVAPLALYLWPRGGVLGWLAGFTALWNTVGLSFGAFTPIDIPGVFTTDGGTLLRYWGRK